jgi:hypothetical protein
LFNASADIVDHLQIMKAGRIAPPFLKKRKKERQEE